MPSVVTNVPWSAYYNFFLNREPAWNASAPEQASLKGASKAGPYTLVSSQQGITGPGGSGLEHPHLKPPPIKKRLEHKDLRP